ncbi:MAG TPA: amino acid adenylation domain-containing protein, partial [Myxococcus sp.]|nr:amino acid adenylation domain-containing protein [Myxococcus sp.]
MKNVDDIYRLSPMQQGLLFHTLGAPGQGTYVEVVYWNWNGEVDLPTLQRAWQRLVDRHTALRTAFFWENMKEPLQAVRRKVDAVPRLEDCSGVPPEQREARFAEVLEREQRQDFNLSAAPLVRFTLVRFGPGLTRCIVAYHHLVMDGWSLPVCLRELFLTYDALKRGEEPPLEGTRPYREYIVWLSKQQASEAERFWRERLRGFTSATPLAAPDAGAKPGTYTVEALGLGTALTARLAAFTRQHQVTLSTLVQGAWALLQSRYTGQDDVAFGTVVSGRPPSLPGVDTVLGTFINTQVTRVRLPSSGTVLPWLKALQAELLAARAFEHVSLVDVQGWSEVPRGQPLFDTLVVFENMPRRGLSPEMTARLPVDGFARTEGRTGYPLIFTVLPDASEMEVRFTYDTGRFEAATLRRMLGHLSTLLHSLVDAPEGKLADVSMLPPEEARQLAEWAGTRTEYPREAGLHALFEAQARSTPDAVAVESEGSRLTYAELDARANQLARHLRGQGVGPEVRVAVCLERAPELVVALLAILKAGGAYVPLEPGYPAERLALMLQQAGAGVLVTHEALADELPTGSSVLVLVDADAGLISAQSPEPLGLDVGGDALAYVMFTSGSTGQPKGVCVPHRGVVRLVKANPFIRFGPEHTFLQLAPAAFDASTLELWGALLHGAKLVLAPARELSLEEIGALLERHRVSTLWLTAALFEQMVLRQGEPLARVPQLLAGGDVLPAQRVREHLARLPEGSVLVNGYGPTENTTFSATHTLRRGDVVGASVPIGRPIAHSTVYVLDGALKPVPVGVPGELYVGGDGLARGYLGRPALTAERFVPHPLAATPGERLYRTGDKVRWSADGTLEFLGRNDFQVKVRGFRIELGEVEAVLRQAPGVEEAVVVVREDVPGDKRLVAYVVGEAVEPRALRAFLEQKLPEYMVPSALVPLPALPLNANGKVDRKALPAPEAPTSDAEAYVAPRTATEETLTRIFAEVLNLPRVGVHDDFFELGGHSLLATQVVSRIRATLDVELPLGELFTSPTVAALAGHLETLGRANQQPIPLAPRDAPLPLSFAQQRLWFLDQLQPGSATYNIAAALKLEGSLDAEALRQALQALVQRHEALRTSFVVRDGVPTQHIHPEARVELPVVELEPARRDAEAARLAREEALRPFDLAQGPLVRTTLLRLAPEQHLLLVTMHHIISDGWSIAVMVRELGAYYRQFLGGEPAGLPPLPVQYADHAVWQREWLRGEVLKRKLEWWKQELTGAPAALELPTDRPRPAAQTYAGAVLPVRLPRALSEAVKALAQREGATPFMVLLASFQLLLSRYSGQEDVVVGSPIANRNRAETEGLIGFFVNTLALRTRIDARQSFSQLLRQVRQRTLAAYEHQDVPFEKLVEELQPQRDLSRSPLFQVTLTLQNAPTEALRLPGLTLRLLPPDVDTSKFDFSLLLEEGGEGFSGLLNYNTDLFDAGTMERLLRHYAVLLEAAVAAPEQRLGLLPLLTPDERRQVVEQWSGTASPYPRDASIHALFAEQAARTPEAVALVSGEEQVTYAQLDTRANQLAHHLRGMGVQAGSQVALCLERSVELVVGLLGILKAGAAYVPLDSSWPAERMAYVVRQAGTGVLLTSSEVADALPELGCVLVVLDEESSRLARQPTSAPGLDVGAEALAYVMFTSGSTGQPKGVCVPHRGVVRLARNGFMDLGPREVWLQAAPVAFDASTLEVWGALLNGARLVMAPARGLSLEELGRQLVHHGITALWLTAALYEQLVAHQPHVLAGVRQVLAGGDVLPVQRVREHRARLPEGSVLVNGYGPTENTTFSSTHTLRRGDAVARSVPIGRPLSNSTVYVLDGALQPVPVGVPGELYVGGDGLARGYLGRPELTAERFVPHPLAATPGERLYRTGDKVRWSADGTLEFLGRNDFQVKVRGFRIELGEVEAVLRQAPGVEEAVVVVREDVPGDKRLVAYVVGEAVESRALRAFLEQKLPEYMVPSALVPLPALPLNANGKVDRKALPAPEAPTSDVDTFVAPRTPTEEQLARIFAEVLGAARVGVHDDFFELGGHSLLATQVVSRIRATLGVELPLGELFSAPTVDALAGRLAHLGRASQQSILLAPRDAPLPLSFAQQRLWFLDQLEPGSAFYNVPGVLHLEGALDTAALGQALRALMIRHEVLRTTFQREAGVPTQRIHPEPLTELTTVELEALSSGARDAEARRLASEEALRPFDLERGPLIRLRLLRLGPTEHRLLVTLHHIISDGWSIDVMLRELGVLYRAFASGQTPELPPLPVQYADFAAWQRQWLQADVLQSRLDWWRQQLAGAPSFLDLPTDRPRPALQTHHGATLGVRLSAALSRAVEELAQRHGATPFMVLLAAWQVLLSRYSGQEDVCVGSPIAGRNRAETEGLIGFFVNTLVLRARLDPRASFLSLLEQVKATALAAYEHQDVPFERLVEELRPERSLSHSPLFQVMFTLQNTPLGGVELPGLRLRLGETASPIAKFDLSLTLLREPDGFAGTLEYNTDLFDASTVERMDGHFQVLLEALLARPEQALAPQPLLTAQEHHRVLVEWNATAAPFPEDLGVHQLFEAQARRTPTAVAVEAPGVRLTYAELDARAGRLARHLCSLGVGPEVRAGLCVERSPDMVVGMLAVLKAGGAYVPLDPDYPRERLAFMLQDCGAPVLLTWKSLAGLLPPGPTAVFLDGELEPAVPVSEASFPDSPAYVLYTSGTTGLPKGTLITHRALANHLTWMVGWLGVKPGDRALQLAAMSFDASVAEVFSTLLAGATVVLPPPGVQRDAAAVAEALVRERITLLQGVPSLLRALLEQPALPRATTLRGLVSGGEALPAELVPALHAKLPGTRLYNHYGPTEATIDAAAGAVSGEAAGGSVSIGRPVANTRAYVLDAWLRPVPAGVPGELYLGGTGLARGYLRRPELTAEKFLPDPFGGEPGSRLYRTGDKARWRADGTLEYLGRIDTQVKLRGFRIELGEVESTLARLPSVREAVALVREEASGNPRLVAYVVPAEGATLDGATLRQALKQRLPEYMVPSAIAVLEALPLTPSGKVDRKALPALDGAQAVRMREYVAPRTPVEEQLAALWAELLRVERVGAHDDFFELGGHSLLATQLVARLRTLFAVELPLRALFGASSLEGLAREVDAARQSGQGALAPPTATPRTGAPLPLSFAQQRLWFLDQFAPGTATHNMPAALWLDGMLDVAALERAFAELVRRHESLRTTFRDEGGTPVQVIHPPVAPHLPVVDLTGHPAPEAEVLRLAREEASRPFSLSTGPLLRTTLLKVGEARHALLLTMHHIVTDGWSMEVLVREMAALYRAFSAGQPSPLPEPRLQYADYALWQRGWLQGEALEAQLSWWREHLAGAPPVLELPTDFPRPSTQGFRGAILKRVLPRELAGSLHTLCRHEGTTLFMALLAGFQVVLSRYSGQEDFVVGTDIANRNQAETEGLIGFFINQLALRARLEGARSFRELLGRVREVTLGSYAHQDLPFEELVKALNPERGQGSAPLFQVKLVLQNQPASELEVPGLTLRTEAVDLGVSRLDLTLSVMETARGLECACEYRTDLFEAQTIDRLVRHLGVVLEAAVARPEAPLSSLSLMSEAEQRQVLVDWNATG